MARYLLGEAGAKWLRTAMSQKAPDAAVGATRHIPSSRGDPDGFLHPFALQYAASAGAAGEGEGPAGAWIIWLPAGCLVIDGEAVDVTVGLTAARGYPFGWYELTDIFDGDDPSGFDLYLDAVVNESGEGQSAAVKFALSDESMENPVLIAKVSEGKSVKGIVESAIVVSAGGVVRTLTVNVYGLYDMGYADPGVADLTTTIISRIVKDPNEPNKVVNVPGLKAGTGISITKSGNHYVIGLSGGGDDDDTDSDSDVAGSGGIFSWTASTRTIGPGGCMVGRKWFTCTTGTGAGKVDGLYQLRVTLATSGGVSLAVVSDALLGADPTSTQCWIPIYQITNGKIAVDYRGAFVVPAYE